MYNKEEMGDLLYDDEIFQRLNYKGEESIYLVSSYGRVWSLKHKKYLSISLGNKGRNKVHLYLNGKGRTMELARVIALTFLGDGEGLDADHIDNDPTNDVLSNIQWLTPYENKSKAHRDGCIHYCDQKQGEDAEASIYSNETVSKACEMMEQGKNSKEISKETGLPMPVIYNIYYKRDWTIISDNYKVENMSKAPIERVSKEVGNFIHEKIKEGFTNREIESLLESKFGIISGYNIVSNRRRRLRENGEI